MTGRVKLQTHCIENLTPPGDRPPPKIIMKKKFWILEFIKKRCFLSWKTQICGRFAGYMSIHCTRIENDRREVFLQQMKYQRQLNKKVPIGVGVPVVEGLQFSMARLPLEKKVPNWRRTSLGNGHLGKC